MNDLGLLFGVLKVSEVDLYLRAGDLRGDFCLGLDEFISKGFLFRLPVKKIGPNFLSECIFFCNYCVKNEKRQEMGHPCLGISGAVVFAGVSLYTSDPFRKVISLLIAVNAVLCHIGGFLQWDLFCNVFIATYVIITELLPPDLMLLTSFGGVAWTINHFTIQNPMIHFLLVQVIGAFVLCNLNVRKP